MNEDKKSYNQIFKSTGIIGGSQVGVILIGIIRTKIIALFLGPTGYGIASSLQATIDLMRQATGFGLNFSAVREISQEASTRDEQRTGRIITILMSWARYTGLLGVVLTLVLCYPLSWYAFDNADYVWHIAAVAIVLITTSISSAQVAVLQGFRQLRKMALASICGAVVGTAIVVPLYFLYGISAIVPAIILTSLGTLFISWLYTRKIQYQQTQLTFRQTIKGGLSMARLGLYLVATSFIVTLIMYTIRAFVVRQMGLEAVGWFQASWSISTMYVGIVLSAMGADFFPRLSAIHQDNVASNKLINQQLEMVMIIVSPLLIALVAAAPLVINILYSGKFDPAIPLLQWQLVGGFFGVISWCLGVMFLAKNKAQYGLIFESLYGVVYFLFVFFTWEYIGFISLGVGFLLTSICKAITAVFLVRKLGAFRFTIKSLQNVLVFGMMTVLVLVNVILTVGAQQYILSSTILLASLIYSYFQLRNLVDLNGVINKLLKRK